MLTPVRCTLLISPQKLSLVRQAEQLLRLALQVRTTMKEFQAEVAADLHIEAVMDAVEFTLTWNTCFR